MKQVLAGAFAAALVSAATFGSMGTASAEVAGPRVASALGTQPTAITQVRWRRHWHRGWHRGGWGWWGPGAGFATGLFLGSALAPRPYYAYPYRYYPYAYQPVEGAVEYCMRRFKSYNPASGTYLGYDGHRHRCP